MTSHHEPRPTNRVILLGASNLTLGFPFILRTLQAGLNVPLEVYAALGHGRSYGMWSRVLHRTLPGIAECGLWTELQREWPGSTEGSPRNEQTGGALHSIPATPPRALLTDVGNDLLYGAPPEQIADWVETCLQRLAEQGARIVLTTLPITSVERLSAWRYNLTRMIFFPGKGPCWPEMQKRAFDLNDRLCELAQRYETHVVQPPGEWYGLDPIHVRHIRRKESWRHILSQWPNFDPPVPPMHLSPPQRLRLRRHQPARRRVFGREQSTPQPLHWLKGVTVSLY